MATNSGIIGDNYCLNLETTDCDDNCQFTYNPDQADVDNDGLGDLCDNCCIGVRGNSNCDEQQSVDIADITYIIRYLFIEFGQWELCCQEEADANGNGGEPDIADIVRLIDYLYYSGRPLEICP